MNVIDEKFIPSANEEFTAVDGLVEVRAGRDGRLLIAGNDDDSRRHNPPYVPPFAMTKPAWFTLAEILPWATILAALAATRLF